VRSVCVAATLILSACAPAPPPVEHVQADPTREPGYAEATGRLTAMSLEAEGLLKSGKPDQAAALITAGQPLLNRLLSVPRPTLPAMEAVSDLDQLYGRMLLENRNYGWARLLFQKNLIRWKNWKPQTPETARRVKLAAAAIAECDRHLGLY